MFLAPFSISSLLSTRIVLCWTPALCAAAQVKLDGVTQQLGEQRAAAQAQAAGDAVKLNEACARAPLRLL